jgi:hypothetical protein
VHAYDANFRFGVRKAQMLLACVDILRSFWHSTAEERLRFRPCLVEDQRRTIRVLILMEMHPDFEHSTGETIDRPWLRLTTLPDKEHIGLGVIKCRAICEVKEELRRWLQAQSAFVPEATRQIALE